MIPFHVNLRSWREFRNLTQEEMSLRSGISRPNLANLESGKKDCVLSTLRRMATILTISPGTLLDTPPPSTASALNRHEIDLIARNLLGKRQALPPSLKIIRDEAAAEAVPLLQLVHRFARTRKRKVSFHHRLDVDRVLRRVSKLLPHSLRGASL